MAGIGDSWGTAQELMHPRDAHGRFRSKWKMPPGVLAAVEKVLTAFQPRTFQSDSQAAQYNFNLANAKKPKRFGGGKGYARLQADYHAADEDLRDGNIDEPSTKKFVDMMDESMIDLPDDVIVSRVVGPDAFGLTPERLPELEEMTGNVIADRGYGAANIGTPLGGGQGMITMIHAVPKGTKMAIPARNPNDRAMFFDRDQELTVSKVKPDGRGGYNMFVVATPKTAGETPQAEGVGHQGVGTSHDREAAVKGLEDAATKREMGQQPAGALPDQPSEPQSARAARAAGAPHVPGTAQPQAGEDETGRAARRSRILGRPTGANASPEAQKEAAAPAAPAATPSVPGPTPEAPAPAANVPAAPEGATSVVTGNPVTSFRDAAKDLESPSAGPRRREWNSAYQGVVSGKQHPNDMLRELESDIANNKKAQDTELGRGDSSLAADIEKQEKLADLIRSHFTLGEPVERKPRQEVRNELNAKAAAKAAKARPSGTEKAPPGQKSATEKAVSGPMAPFAPKRTDGTAESRAKEMGTQREKDLADDALNEEQRSRWADEVGKEPAGLGPKDASGILLDETADQLRNGRTTRAKAAERLREQGRDIDTPAADYLRKVADAIEADTSKPAKRVPLKKRPPKPAADVAEAEKKLSGRTEKNILTGLNGLSVGELRGLSDKWGVDQRGDDKKLKLKAALAKELAAKWKATPELHGKKENAPEKPGAKFAGDAAAVARIVESTRESDRQRQEKLGLVPKKVAPKAAVKKAVPAKKAEPAPFDSGSPPENAVDRARWDAVGSDNERDAIRDDVEKAVKDGATPDQAWKEALNRNDEAALADAKKSVSELGAPKTPAAKALTQVAEAPETPPVVAEAAKKAAAREAEIAGFRAAREAELSNPEKKTVSTSRLQVGEKLQIQQGADGLWDSTARKTGAKTLTVTGKKRVAGDRGLYEISGTDEDGNQITLRKLGQNVVHRAGITAPKKATVAKPSAPEAPAVPEAPEVPKIAGIDTAERAHIQARAKEVLAELKNGQQADPFDQMEKDLKQLPGGQHATDLVKMAKEIRDEVTATSGPSGVSVEDRVAARLLSRVKPEFRDSILSEMPEKDRKHLIGVAEKVAAEDARVKASGHDLDKIMADGGFKVPTSAQGRLEYDGVKRLLAQNNVPEAKAEVQRILRGSDVTLNNLRSSLNARDQTQANKEFLGKRITEELAHADWAASVGRALDSGDSPELITRKEAKEVIPFHVSGADKSAFTPEALKELADQQGIKLPEGAVTRDQILTEVARDMIRKQQAGTLKPPEPVKLPVKKAAPKVEHAPIDARTLVPGSSFDEGTDKKILDRVQGLLDGDPEHIANAGMPKGKPTPAAVGRYLDRQVANIGTQRAMDSLTLTNAKQRLADDPGKADYWNPIIAEHEASQKSFQDQMDRLTLLADKLKKTRRTPVKKAAAPAAPEAPKPEALSAPPIKATLARAAKTAPPAKTPAPSATAAKKAAPTVEKQVAKKAARKEVQAELGQVDAVRGVKSTAPARKLPKGVTPEQADAAVKKATKAAAPKVSESSGEKKYTNDELQGMSLGDLVDIENERGIKRTSVAKKDRIQAILDQQEVAPAPEPKKVSAAASKADAARIEAAPPSKAAPTKVPGSKIQAGKYSTKPPEPNSWGSFADTPMHYHDDGFIGQAVKDMGAEGALDVNGDRLDNVVGRIATDTVTGRATQQEMIDKLTKLADELPAGSKSKALLKEAVDRMDTPERTIDIPDGTPAPLVALAKKLENIPLARDDREGEGSSELTRLEGILKKLQEGKLSNLRVQLTLQQELLNNRHESNEGKFELDRAVKQAIEELKKKGK